MVNILKIKDKEYKLRLTAMQICALERREGKGLLKILTGMESEGNIVEIIVKLLHASMLDNHKEIKLEMVYEMYDDLVEFENYTMIEFQRLIEDILETAGLSDKSKLGKK